MPGSGICCGVIRLPRLLIAALLLVASLTAAHAQTPKPKPTLWISPPGQDKGKAFRDLFEHPDDWKETRAMVDVLFATDLGFQRNYSDEELTRWFGQMRDWNLKFAMEVGAIKEWGKTGAECFTKE